MITGIKVLIRSLLPLLILHPLTCLSAPSPNNQTPQSALHSHAEIIHTAQQFLLQQIDRHAYSRLDIKMGRLDQRLRLTQCQQPLLAQLAAGAQLKGKTTVYIRCADSRPWTVYLGAHIDLYTQVVQTTRPLNRNHIIRGEDLSLVEANISQLRNGYFSELQPLIGQQLKRRIGQMRIIKSTYVKPPTLVKRGDVVSIVAEKPGYSVKMSGIAMKGGSKGQRIQVKNLSSKRLVEGTIVATGVVSIH